MATMDARKLPDGCTLVTFPDCPGYGLVIPMHGLYIPVKIVSEMGLEPFYLNVKHGYGDPPTSRYVRVVDSQNAGYRLFCAMIATQTVLEAREAIIPDDEGEGE